MVFVLVRGYIFTEREKKIAKRYLETGEKLETLGILLYHLRKAYPDLESDMELAKKLLDR